MEPRDIALHKRGNFEQKKKSIQATKVLLETALLYSKRLLLHKT